jgi:hypothetical protein
MDEIDAGFVVTGEVIGQRPMSQRRQPLSIIERDTGLEGLLLRPLSAKLLDPTTPERLGIVDREKLWDLAGRSRHAQIERAEERSITGFSQPAGGCQLTDEHFANKVKDLFAHEERPTTKDMELLTIGRHLRLSPSVKVILGRNELENLLLEGYADDRYAVIRPKFAGPAALVVGVLDDSVQHSVAQAIIQQTKAEKLPEGPLEFRCGTRPFVVDRAALRGPSGASETVHA